MTILQYKFGLNNIIRAAGEFVCDRVLYREKIFAKTNKFYYTVVKSDPITCQMVRHADSIQKYQLMKEEQTLEHGVPNSKYVVFDGALLRILSQPQLIDTQNQLVVILREENPSFLETLADQMKKLRCNSYLICKGIT